MALNFPDVPTGGQIFNNYVWDGEKWLTRGGATLVVARNYLSGLELSNGAAATLNVAAGAAADSTNIDMIALNASMYKATQATWGVGNGAGSLDTGSFAISTWFHVFLIKRPDTGLVDILTSRSATAPTLPANYTRARRIGSVYADSASALKIFIQHGDTFIWPVPYQGTIASPAGALFGLLVPPDIRVEAMLGIGFSAASAAENPSGIAVIEPAFDLGPSGGMATVLTYSAAYTINNIMMPVRCFTNLVAQVRIRVQVGGTVNVVVFGWIDRRGRDD